MNLVLQILVCLADPWWRFARLKTQTVCFAIVREHLRTRVQLVNSIPAVHKLAQQLISTVQQPTAQRYITLEYFNPTVDILSRRAVGRTVTKKGVAPSYQVHCLSQGFFRLC